MPIVPKPKVPLEPKVVVINMPSQYVVAPLATRPQSNIPALIRSRPIAPEVLNCFGEVLPAVEHHAEIRIDPTVIALLMGCPTWLQKDQYDFYTYLLPTRCMWS